MKKHEKSIEIKKNTVKINKKNQLNLIKKQ